MPLERRPQLAVPARLLPPPREHVLAAARHPPLAGRRDSARAAVARPLRRQRARGGPLGAAAAVGRRFARGASGAGVGLGRRAALRAAPQRARLRLDERGLPRRAGRDDRRRSERRRRRVARREGHAAEAGAHPRWQLPKRWSRDGRRRLRGAALREDGRWRRRAADGLCVALGPRARRRSARGRAARSAARRSWIARPSRPPTPSTTPTACPSPTWTAAPSTPSPRWPEPIGSRARRESKAPARRALGSAAGAERRRRARAQELGEERARAAGLGGAARRRAREAAPRAGGGHRRRVPRGRGATTTVCSSYATAAVLRLNGSMSSPARISSSADAGSVSSRRARWSRAPSRSRGRRRRRRRRAGRHPFPNSWISSRHLTGRRPCASRTRTSDWCAR